MSNQDIITTLTPTLTATPGGLFTATMQVIPSKTELVISETLDVRVSIGVSEGCFFPIFELELRQIGDDAPTFAYVSPMTHTVGPPVNNPFTYTLQAVKTGTITFLGDAYGEEGCGGGGWIWRHIISTSGPVNILNDDVRIYFPSIQK